jgi:hypothetical protein
VNFAAITLCVAFQRVFVVVAISLWTQSGNFWIYLPTSEALTPEFKLSYV